MFLAFNYAALQPRQNMDEDDQGAWVSISDDMETRARGRGLFLSRLPNEALMALPADELVADAAAAAAVSTAQIAAAAAESDVAAPDEGAEAELEESVEDDVYVEEMKEGELNESPQDRLLRFINGPDGIISRWRITPGFRFNSDMQNRLQQELIAEGLADTLDYVRAKIVEEAKKRATAAQQHGSIV